MASIIIITIVGIAVLYLGLYKAEKALLPASVLGLVIAGWTVVSEWNTNASYFSDVMRMDNYAVAFSILLIVITALTFLISTEYFEKLTNNVAECYAILLFALAGGITMVSFQNLSMLFIGIEILSVSMYVMAGINKLDSGSNEASLKYFLMGAFATGILLFGIALIYGATGSFHIDVIAANAAQEPVLFGAGILFILIALAFKVGMAPFHFWTPDVYQGAPTLITTFMATVVKTAAFASFFRLFGTVFTGSDAGLSWVPTASALVLLTLLIGNISAAYQQSVKRMMAFSSVSHAGYMFIAILTLGFASSANALFFYSVAYSAASLVVFGGVIAVQNNKDSDTVSAFNGLAKTNPVLALVMTIAICSLAGIPLTAGFIGKFYMFQAALNADYVWLVAVAVLMAAVGIYYYFRIIIAMYFRESDDETIIMLPLAYRFALILSAVITVALGLVPGLMSNLL